MLIDINAPLPPTVLQLPIICLAITSYPCLILLLYSLYRYANRRKKTIINKFLIKILKTTLSSQKKEEKVRHDKTHF